MGRSVRRVSWLLLSLPVALALTLVACKAPPPPAPPHRTVERPPAAVAAEAEREREALEAAVEAYVYGYPLVSAELARRIATNVEKPQAGQAPMGQLSRPRAGEPPAAAAPRASFDTLAAGAWLDVAAEPWVLSVPDAKGRFTSLTVRSAWQELLDATPPRGGRARAGRIAVTGPGWSGKLPAGVREVKSPTALVRIEARVLAVGGPSDPHEGQAWIDRLSLLPLGANPRKWTPALGRPDASLDVGTPVRDQVHALDAVVYFKLLATLLKTNPPGQAGWRGRRTSCPRPRAGRPRACPGGRGPRPGRPWCRSRRSAPASRPARWET